MTESLADRCRRFDISEKTVRSRLKLGWSLRMALTKKPRRRHQHGESFHGKITKEYRTWVRIIHRCHGDRIKDSDFRNYKGRGISVCKRWRNSYQCFLEDMGRCPKGKTSIDRINNSKGYSKSNCRWASQREQLSNTRVNRVLSFRGLQMTVVQWARHLGLNKNTLYNRLSNLGWSVEETLTREVGQNGIKEIETRPSAAARWSNCYASALLERRSYDSTSEAAVRGTRLHEEAFRYSNGEPGNYDEDAIEAVRVCNCIIADFLEDPDTQGDIIEIKEERLEVEGYENIAGTADRIVKAGKKALLIDMKFGNIMVKNSADNTQLIIYAGLTMLKFPDVEEVMAVIVQPSNKYFPIPFLFKKGEVLPELDRLNRIAKMLRQFSEERDMPFKVGNHCLYCKAKAFCGVYMESLGIKDLVTISNNNNPIEGLRDEDLVQIFKAKALIAKVEKFFDAVKAELTNRLAERQIEGVEWGTGRGSRVWHDALSAASQLEQLGLDPWKTELISPHAAELKLREKKVAKSAIAGLIVSIAGKPVVKLSEGDDEA